MFAALFGLPADRLFAIGRDFSPRLERMPGGIVVLDIAGLQRLFGDSAAIGGALVRAGVSRVAIAATGTAARLLVRAHDDVSVATGEPGAAIRDIPLAVLKALATADAGTAAVPLYRPPGRRRLPASGDTLERVFSTLERWGLTTVGELAALPAGELSARLGTAGEALQRLARGIDPRPLVPDPGVRRFTATFELEWPIDTIEPLSFVFARLLEPLAAALEQADRGAVALHLSLRLTDRRSHARSLSLPAAMRDPRVLRTLLLLDLESHPPPAAVDVVSIELDPAPARIVQYSLLERALPSPETMATLMARLGALVGEARCGSPVLLDTHRPDGFEMGRTSFQSTANAQLPTPKASGSSHRGEHRPDGRSRYAIHPDASTRVPWELEIGRWALPCVLRRFRPPVAVRVAVEGGRPVRMAIDRRGLPGGAVTQAAGPWRTTGGWWEHGRWDRDEWDVAVSDDAVCRIFRDRAAGAWFLDGVYD